MGIAALLVIGTGFVAAGPQVRHRLACIGELALDFGNQLGIGGRKGLLACH
jgi:hypothetical protein